MNNANSVQKKEGVNLWHFGGEIIIFSEEKRKEQYCIHKNEEEKTRDKDEKRDIFGWKNVQKETRYDEDMLKMALVV